MESIEASAVFMMCNLVVLSFFLDDLLDQTLCFRLILLESRHYDQEVVATSHLLYLCFVSTQASLYSYVSFELYIFDYMQLLAILMHFSRNEEAKLCG